MSAPQPAWYGADDLPGFESWAWSLVARGVADRRSPFHTPALASVGADGAPDTRTLVLRGAEPTEGTLRFHTDARAGKVAQLSSDPRVSVLFYDGPKKLQLRMAGTATLLDTASETGAAAWAATRKFSRQCYRVSPAPGSHARNGGAFSFPDAEDEGEAAFRIVVVRVREVEALYLAAGGHRRARFGDEREWLVP